MTRNDGGNIRPNPSGHWPEIHRTAYVDPTACVIGRVAIGPDVYVGPQAVIRADEPDGQGRVGAVVIGPQCNVQDGAIVHALGGTGVTLAQRTSLSHGCVVHGPCRLGQGCFVGFRAVLFRSQVADNVFIGHGAVVQNAQLDADSVVAAGQVIDGRPPQPAPPIGPDQREFIDKVVAANTTLCRGYCAARQRPCAAL